MLVRGSVPTIRLPRGFSSSRLGPLPRGLFLCYNPRMSTYMLEVDKEIALPKDATEALPAMTQQEELEVYARTIKLLADLQGKPLEPDEKDKETARELAKKMLTDGEKVDFANYRNETLAYLAGMVTQYDQMVVRDYADLKIYVVNKLIEQSTNPDPKFAIPALKALGEIDGVDAFKKRSEVTVQHKTAEEVETALRAKLEKLEKLVEKGRKTDVIDVEVKDADAGTD